jgi:hypothetical protein
MTNKKRTNQNELSGNWKKLAPKSARKPASKAAFRKRLLGLTKVFTLIVILALVGSVVWFFQQRTQSASGPIDITGTGAPISKLIFITDGVLHKRWFQNWFGPLRGRTLMDLDIEEIQSELKGESQISFVRVSRKFPATLKIELKEKKPILRLCLRSKSKGEQTWLVSGDGSLYLGTCYSNASLVHLPFLNLQPDLLKPKMNGDGYAKLAGIPAVAPLLDLARREYPGFYQNWQVVSYQRPHDDDPGAHIHIKSGKVRNLRFAPQDFAIQLRRLKYLLMESDFRRTQVVESIDLSHDRSVFAKLTPS